MNQTFLKLPWSGSGWLWSPSWAVCASLWWSDSRRSGFSGAWVFAGSVILVQAQPVYRRGSCWRLMLLSVSIRRVAVNIVNKWMKQTQRWRKQQVLLLLSGGIASEPDWAPGEAAWASGQSNRGRQRPGFATCLCHPLPASPRANRLLSPPSLDGFYFCVLWAPQGRGCIWKLQAGVRDITNTEIIGCQFAG